VVEVLEKFAIDSSAVVKPIGNGHINKTFKVDTGSQSYILQRINKDVFTKPEVIARNLELAKQHLIKTHPGYLFIAPLHGLVYDNEGHPWRLYPYIERSYTIEEAQNVNQAYEGARAFGKFGQLMKGCPLSDFKPTIERFHDLALRYDQFQSALASTTPELKATAIHEIDAAIKNKTLVERYNSIIKSNTLKPGIFHNDTKINNVLFDGASHNAIAVIDLDTVMEGYFIYDLGDLARTLVSPAGEEEKDLSKVVVRKEFYDAVIDGYMSGMKDVDTSLASFAGLMMTYIMALRFLADHLRGNTYYHVTYADQNLVRARNQFRLLHLLYQVGK